MTTTRVRLAYSVGSAVVSVLLTCVVGSAYVTSQIDENTRRIRAEEQKSKAEQRENDLALCQLVAAIRQVPPRPSAAQPSTPYGIEVAKAQARVQEKLKNLDHQLECPNPPRP